MACAACERRRAWLKKWAKVAYERARGITAGAIAGRFALRLLESGDVRLIGLSLPGHVVADLLRAAADVYEANAAPETVN